MARVYGTTAQTKWFVYIFRIKMVGETSRFSIYKGKQKNVRSLRLCQKKFEPGNSKVEETVYYPEHAAYFNEVLLKGDGTHTLHIAIACLDENDEFGMKSANCPVVDVIDKQSGVIRETMKSFQKPYVYDCREVAWNTGAAECFLT